MVFVIFFSSRRRHTRYWRYWISDVCSSDLPVGPVLVRRGVEEPVGVVGGLELAGHLAPEAPAQHEGVYQGRGEELAQDQIGRATCRERAYIPVVAGSLKKYTITLTIKHTLQ